MKRLNEGNALAQYGIIILLIALSCFAVYALLGQNIVKALSGFSNMYKASEQAVLFKNSSGEITSYQPGDLNGSKNAPVTECNGDSCIIDYGDFILSGIPANFSDESISSRGNDDLTKVMA